MDIHLLEAFVAVADVGTITQAARELHRSQPAVTAQIKSLEHHLGLDLFDRGAQGMRLTVAGQRLLDRARGVVRARDQVEHLAAALRDGTPERTRLGIIDDGYGLMLKTIASDLRLRLPDVTLVFVNGSSGEQRQRVTAGELEAAIVEGPVLEQPLAAWSLHDVPLQIIAPPDWRTELEHADLIDLARKPWCFMSEHCSYHQLMKQISDELGIALKPRFISDSVQTVLNLVADGQAVSLFNRDRAAEAIALGKVWLWPRFHARMPRSVIMRRDRADEPAVQHLVESCRRAFADWPSRMTA